MFSVYTRWQKRLMIVAVSLFALLATMATSMYYPALPTVASDLGVTVTEINLSVTTFMVSKPLCWLLPVQYFYVGRSSILKSPRSSKASLPRSSAVSQMQVAVALPTSPVSPYSLSPISHWLYRTPTPAYLLCDASRVPEPGA